MNDPTGRHRLPTQAASWTARDLERADLQSLHSVPLIAATDFSRIGPEIDIWDAWPLQDAAGMPVDFDGAEYWMALAAPRFADPDERHGHARIHLLRRSRGQWRDMGPAMPDGFSPGSREWSGSAVLDDAGSGVTLYFTAAGRRGEAPLSFEQRLFAARARFDGERLADWHDLREIAVPDPRFYMASDEGSGTIGTIKAFRDPAYFRDPADGRQYLFFAGSLAGSASAFNGVVGWVTAPPGNVQDWTVLPPLVSADGFNNELERPHVIRRGELYYLFWSTQSHVFAPDGPTGPTGLYGMASPSLGGEWRPLNGSGLVFGNPAAAPRQAYSWLVLPDLRVASFVDDWGDGTETTGPRRFGASFAPMLQLRLDGLAAELDVR